MNPAPGDDRPGREGPAPGSGGGARALPRALERMEEMAAAELAEAALRVAHTPAVEQDPLEACLAWDMAAPPPVPGKPGGDDVRG